MKSIVEKVSFEIKQFKRRIKWKKLLMWVSKFIFGEDLKSKK